MQVQYVFVELPKAPERRPSMPGADLWAWLFVHAPELKEVPGDLPPGPFREALEGANMATFTPGELEAYERAWVEAQQVIEIGKESYARGFLTGRREALLGQLAGAGITLTEEERARVEACKGAASLDRWIDNVALAVTAVRFSSSAELGARVCRSAAVRGDHERRHDHLDVPR